MKLSPKQKMKMNKVAIITICYVIFNGLMVLYLEAFLNSPFVIGTTPLYDSKTALFINLLIGFLAGTIGGYLLIHVNEKVYRKKSLAFALATTGIMYTLVFVFIVSITQLVATAIVLQEGTLTDQWMASLSEIVFNPSLVSNYVLWLIVTLFTLFMLQVSDKFGQGVMRKFLLGKYYKPRTETRIFMFLDLRSSTTIAEKIGNEQYFHFLSDLFVDVTDTILNNGGEIYQYVGDEIVISWPISKGAYNERAIRCFLEIKHRLKEIAPFYQEKYGIEPEFKAGLHCGPVMAGEVGVIKKDIVYSGDTLNTTSRIQEQCNKYNVDFLLSEEVYAKVDPLGVFKAISLGNIGLRGREKAVMLKTISI